MIATASHTPTARRRRAAEPLPDVFQTRFRRTLKTLGLTQSALAQELRVSAQQLSHVVTGHRLGSGLLLKALELRLGLACWHYCTGQTDQEPPLPTPGCG